MTKKIALLILAIVLIPGLVFAQNSGGLVNCGAQIEKDKVVPGTSCTLKNFIDLAVKVINLAIQLSGMIAVLKIVQGGLILASAAASGKPEQYQDGKQTVVNALLGLAWVIIAYIFTNSIWTLLFKGTGIENTWMKPWAN